MTLWTRSNIERQKKQFLAWLGDNGAEVLVSTNPWELVRFKTGKNFGIIYTNNSGGINFTGESEKAWNCFKGGRPWRGIAAIKRQQKNKSSVMQTIRARDGDLCFFCLQPVSVDDESQEHLVPLTCGGPNHISNKFLAHVECNTKAGNISAPEKIALHVQAHILKLIKVEII